jgi:hypothetical protein
MMNLCVCVYGCLYTLLKPQARETEEIMGYALNAVPEPQAILRAWISVKPLVGVTAVRTEEDYAQARATIDALLDEVGDNITWMPLGQF